MTGANRRTTGPILNIDTILSETYKEDLSSYQPSYSGFTQFLIFLVAITSAFLQGYQVGIVSGVELFLADDH